MENRGESKREYKGKTRGKDDRSLIERGIEEEDER